MAAAGQTEIFAMGLADDRAAGIEYAGDDGRIDIGHIAFQVEAPFIIGTPARQTLSFNTMRLPSAGRRPRRALRF